MALTPFLRTSQALVRALIQFPTEQNRVSQALVRSVDKPVPPALRVTQALVRTVVKGRTEDPHVRVWTFTLDGHDFYVLRLGIVETLVYDTYSQEWYVYGSGNDDLWRAYTGINWIGGKQNGRQFGSDVVVGDDGNGTLYFLDPDGDYDDDALEGAAIPRSYKREITAQYAITGGYDSKACWGIQLFGDIGKGADGEAVLLEYSDNRGISYVSAGALPIGAEDYDLRLNWQSLGVMAAPGRLFRISDTGALHRIDGVEMEDDGQQIQP